MVEIECELKYYEVEDPYGRAISYYKDEYLCFLEVTPDGIAAQWNWDVHFENDNWYKARYCQLLRGTSIASWAECQHSKVLCPAWKQKC